MKPDPICANHPTQKALGFCHNCHDELCINCVMEGSQHYYCRKPECLKALESEETLTIKEKSWNLIIFARNINPNIRSYLRAFGWTVSLLALYVCLYHVSLPTIGFHDEFAKWTGRDLSNFNILSMGLMPVFSGFILAELLSLVLKPFRGWRLAGKSGREKLNQWAWGFAFLAALLQAYGNNRLVLEIIQETFSSFSLANSPFFQIINISALLGGTFLCVWIARLITQLGIGNGFLILLFYGWVKNLSGGLARSNKEFWKLNPTSDQLFSYYGVIVLLVIVLVFLWKFVQKVPRIPVKRTNGKRLWFEISSLPMSTEPYVLACGIVTSITSIFRYLSASEDISEIPIQWISEKWTQSIFILILMVPLSWLFYNWFYGEINVFGLAIENLPVALRKRKKLLNRNVLNAIAVTLLGTILFSLPWVFDCQFYFRDMFFWILLFTIIQDLWAQWLFWRVHGQSVELLEIDNVHLASYLKGLFMAEKIPCHIQSYRYRRLLFIFAPLIKMRLMVPVEETEKANLLLGTVQFKVV